jgi:uncharacterized damage-inducible protein DinB
LVRCVHVLREHYLPKIKEAVELLSEEELWARENAASNSVGNLLLHLSGNVRQHIISGAGGQEDVRTRPQEFAAEGGIAKAELLASFEQTVLEACAVLEALPPPTVWEERVIQNNKVVLFDDILHVTEHFAYHAGQIIYLVKALRDHRFEWYKHLDPK